MKKITLFKRVFWILGLTAMAVLFLTCEDELQFQKLQNDASNATVSFTIIDGATRTVLPQASLNDVDHYTLLGGKDGATETVLVDQFTGTSTSVTLNPGTWNFTLNAYNASGTHILQGKVQGKQINSSENNQVSFSMSGLKSGTGSIQVTFSFPETAGITCIKTSGDVDEEDFTINGGEASFAYAKNGVDAGDYFINFKFYSGNALQTVITELLLVRNGLTSVKTITLVGEDLKSMLTGTVSISGKPEVWQTLTANIGLLDGNGTISYQWNKDGTAIPGSVGSTYIVKSTDIGSTITVTVTLTYPDYSGSITSEPTATIAALNFSIITENTWAYGNLPTNDEQWFKFTATASPQYIHASFIDGIYVQLYNSSGVAVGSEIIFLSTKRYDSMTVTVGQEYYIRVRPYSSKGVSYRIAFNTSTDSSSIRIALPSTAIQLTANIWWSYGDVINKYGQLYKFTATGDTQYIHARYVSSGDGIKVQLYDSSGATVGSEVNLSSYSYISRTVTVDQEYYIMVRPPSSDGGVSVYEIAFNTSSDQSSIGIALPSAIQLTANTWADGNVSRDGEQWFKFTATGNMQYIHGSFDNPYIFAGIINVQLYNSSGITVGSATNLYYASSYISQTVMVDQEYYIRVRSVDPYFGTYKIGFTTSTTPPN